MIPIKTALISVSDKSNLADLVSYFSKRNISMIATGGTARFIRDLGYSVKEVSEVTGFPEILGGRVKTLHPVIEGGILARRDLEGDVNDLKAHDINPIDCVVCNLYPFEKMMASGETSLEKVVEEIDIGGITLLRASAKNFKHVVILSSPYQYSAFIEELEKNQGYFPLHLSGQYAIQAFLKSSEYDSHIANYLSKLLINNQGDDFPAYLSLIMKKKDSLRYGENPHQKAALYEDLSLDRQGFMNSYQQLGGKELSFNNLYDTQAAYSLVREFTQPATVIVKHNNPCGVAIDPVLAQSAIKALECDPASAFGGIIAFNQTVDHDTAMVFKNLFIEVVIAPEYQPEALKIFESKKNLRILKAPLSIPPKYDIKKIDGGYLVQNSDRISYDPNQLKTVTTLSPNETEKESLLFGWIVAKHVKSNAIILTQGLQTVGIGAGQMSRIDSLKIACMKAGGKEVGSVLASDAFFPFPDVVEAAAEHGITAIIQPGGSIHDQDSIDACNRLGISMVFTGIRHFRH